MKKIEIKMRLAVLIGGLALFMCCGLQCQAQTNQQDHKGVWKILITQKKQKNRQYDYKENGRLFYGTWEKCEQKRKELERKQTADSIAELSRYANNETEYILTKAKLEAEHEDYASIRIGDYGSDCIPDSEYQRLVKVWMSNWPKYELDQIAEEEYANLCAKYQCYRSDSDSVNFKRKLNAFAREKMNSQRP